MGDRRWGLYPHGGRNPVPHRGDPRGRYALPAQFVRPRSTDLATTLLHADHSQEAGKFVVIQDKGIAGTGSAYSLKTYTMPQLTLLDEKTLSDVDMDKSGDAVIPQFAFFNSDGTKRYAVLKQGTGTYLMTF